MLQKLGSGERESMKKNSPSEQLEMTRVNEIPFCLCSTGHSILAYKGIQVSEWVYNVEIKQLNFIHTFCC